MNKMKWSHQRNGNDEESMETNRRRAQKLWILHSVSGYCSENCLPYERHLSSNQSSGLCLHEKEISTQYSLRSSACTYFCLLCRWVLDPTGSFTPMPFLTLYHWKTCLSSHNLSLISSCFPKLLLWLIIFKWPVTICRCRQPARLTFNMLFPPFIFYSLYCRIQYLMKLSVPW